MTRGVKATGTALEFVKLRSGGKLRRDPDNPRFGWVTCPDCPEPEGGGPKEERYTCIPTYGSKKLADFAGRCRPCENRSRKTHTSKKQYPTEDQPLGAYGSFAYWTKRGNKWVPIKCGVCGKPHRVTIFSAVQQGCTGLHKKCFLEVCPLNTMYRYEPLLPKGTKALFNVRATGNRHKVGIECRGCFKETQQVKYVWDKHLLSYLHGIIGVYALLRWQDSGDATLWGVLWLYLKRIRFWDELCSDCVRKRGRSLSKFTKKLMAPSGTTTDFEDEINGEVLVVYENPQIGCECERRVKRDDAISHWKKYPAVCRDHHNDPVAYLERRMEIERRLGNVGVQKNEGPVKKRRGPEKGYNARITEEKVRAAFNTLGRYAPQEKVAEEIGVDARSL